MESNRNGKNGDRFWQLVAIIAIAAAAVFAFLWLSGTVFGSKTKDEPTPSPTVSAEPTPLQVSAPPEESEAAQTDGPSGTVVPSAEELDIEGVSISGKKIVLDAGHGEGVKSGTTSASGRSEAEINLEIAEKVKALLEAEGATVIMTREGPDALNPNYELDMQAREKIITDAAADMFISIHQNEHDDAAATGPQVFFVAQGSVGKRLATAIQDMLNFELERENPRMALDEPYRILKVGLQPSCTVECGFLSNPDESALLESGEYQDKIAQGIADGVKLYVKRFG